MKKKNNKLTSFGIIGIIIFAVLLVMIPSASNTQLKGKDFVEKYASTPNAILIDVRTPSEFASGHIDKAINIDFENQSFSSEIKKLDSSKTYFVYCRSGNRSGQAIPLMKASGIQNIYELQGGVSSNVNTVPLVTTNTTQ